VSQRLEQEPHPLDVEGEWSPADREAVLDALLDRAAAVVLERRRAGGEAA